MFASPLVLSTSRGDDSRALQGGHSKAGMRKEHPVYLEERC